MATTTIYVGIDVSKDALDVAVLGEKRSRQVRNSRKGIRVLAAELTRLNPRLIVVEATGGYEEGVVQGLYEAGLPVALVSPQRVRQYAKARACWPRPTNWMRRTWRSMGRISSRGCMWRKARQAGGCQTCWGGVGSLGRC